jgi:hypothetical protein
MKKKAVLVLLGLAITFHIMAQEQINQSSDLPYYQIPSYPEEYTANTVAARLIDGLGFRYYWATDGLRPEDLVFKPNEEARTSEETIDHILGLSRVVLNSVKKIPNERSGNEPDLTFEEKRRQTLLNIKMASDILKASEPSEMEEFKVVFINKERTTEYPFWNQINGPIADAIWHVGQVVSFRRSSGNPFNSKASVFNGKLRE